MKVGQCAVIVKNVSSTLLPASTGRKLQAMKELPETPVAI